MNLTINYYNKEGMYEFKSTVLFSKVAQLQHYHQAAKELNISQPSLSRSIANLEEELGVLFQKTDAISNLPNTALSFGTYQSYYR